MGRKFLSPKGEQGDASIFLSMILALSVGTAVYYNMDKLNQSLKSSKVTGQKQKAETRNISGLSTATALMKFSGQLADDPDSLPSIYPDPYLGGGSTIGKTNPSPGVTTWSFSGMNLEVMSPADGELTNDAFAAYVKDGKRPKLSQSSKIRFTKPIFDTVNTKYIRFYEAEVTSKSFDDQQLVSKATIPVPAPLNPICVLRSQDGQNKFQANTTITLELLISGIAEEAWIPKTTDAMVAPEGNADSHTRAELDGSAGSVRFMNKVVKRWQVTTPRPLVAVDGQNDVVFETFAYLQHVDKNSQKGSSCKFTYRVAAPAFCKLWTDKASVVPGQCVNITSETVGPVQANSLVMGAADPTGKAIGGLTQNGANGSFCTPTTSNYGTGVAVSKEASDEYSAAVSALNMDQKKALYEELKRVGQDLVTLFFDDGSGKGGGKKIDTNVLLNLSISQFNDLWSLDPGDIADMSKVDFSGFVFLSTLTADQQEALKSLPPEAFAPLKNMVQSSLSSIELLADVDVKVLKALASYDSKMLMAYVGQAIDNAANSSAMPVNYKVVGTITANDGTKNSCLVHVTAGTNQCPFFGAQYPNYGVTQTLTVVNNGQVSTHNFNFKPNKPNWEVAGIATSPVKVEACPPGARCFAVDWGDNRTPFTVVDSADTAQCNATTNLRQDLGCFEANTKIRMADGTDKPIRQLKDKDLIWNPIRKKAMAIQRVMQGPEKLSLWSIETDSGRVRVTAKHPFLTPTGIRSADALKAGDRILGSKGEEVIKASAADPAGPAEWVWNFEVATDSKDPADHAILADGVVTGDLYLQEQLGQMESHKLSELKP